MSTDFAAQRAIMVESQVRVNDVTDYAIQDAMRAVPREALLPAEKAYQAYADAEVDEVSFLLPTRPESATLRDLDELTDLARSLS